MEWLKNLALKRIAQSAIRHGLTLLGGYLIAKGWVTEADWADAVLALAPVIVTAVWSFIEKQADKKRMDTLTPADRVH